jgi:general secretion pathway protein D
MTARVILLAAMVALLGGCASQTAFRKAEEAANRGDWDAAVLGYHRALGLDPGNDRYRAAMVRAHLKASAVHFERGKRYAEAGSLELAIAEFEQTVFLDPENQYAKVELDKVRARLERLRMTPSEIELAKAAAAKKSLAPPKLSPSSNQPIVLKFKDQEEQKIYDAISKISGINFLYDDKLDQDLKTKKSVDLSGVTFERAMDILMLQFKHFYKVIDESTLYIAQDNRAKRTELEDKVIKTFYLSNGDTTQVNTLLRSLLEVRKIAENAQLNSISIKDSPDVVEVAQKIIEANDKAKAELVVDVELLELDRTRLQELGIDLKDKSLTLSFLGGNASVALNNLNSIKQSGNWSIGPIPTVVVNFLKSDSDTKVLSRPQIRVTEGEKAEVHLGNRVPIPTTTFNTSNTVGSNIVPVTSFTYQNTGIQLTLEPRVHHNREITLKLNVEVSSVAGYVGGSGGTAAQPIIGTRQVQTVVRLRDGETSLLSGLLNEEDKSNYSGIPGLGNIPGLRRLTGSQRDEKNTVEVVLTLTPHIIRIPDISEADLEAIWVGTEDNTRLRGRKVNAFGETPFGGPEDAAASAAGARQTRSGAAAGPSAAPGANPSGSPSKSAAPARTTPAAPKAAPPPAGGDDGFDDSQAPAPQGQQSPSGQQPPATPPPPSSLAQVILVSPKSSYTGGETLTLQVQIIGGQNVGSVPFHLRFNPAVLEFVGAVEGDFLRQDGSPTTFVANEVQGAGEVVVGASRVGSGQGASGSGILATFQFRAKTPGSCTFSFTGATVRDPNANNLPCSFTTAIISVISV